MLVEFINGAMLKANYELMEGGEGFYGEIPGFKGVWANSNNLEDCRYQLRETLEEWILLKVRKKSFLPKVKTKIQTYDLNSVLCEN